MSLLKCDEGDFPSHAHLEKIFEANFSRGTNHVETRMMMKGVILIQYALG